MLQLMIEYNSTSIVTDDTWHWAQGGVLYSSLYNGETVLDMDQNMVGWVKIDATGDAGDVIYLKHFEVLDKDGNCYFDNIRLAKQEARYILAGNERAIFESHFSFQEFRYVQILEFPGKPQIGNFIGVVLHTDMEQTVEFSCSHRLPPTG